jgi:predicted nuclease with TOPRIM domain
MAVTKEAQAQLAALPERVSVLETKVDTGFQQLYQLRDDVKDQMTDLKGDVKEMHDCLDQTRDLLADKLEKMQEEYRANSGKYFEHADKLHAEDVATHNKLGSRIDELEKVKSKWTMYVMAALAFAAGTGWLNSVSFPHILKFLGL